MSDGGCAGNRCLHIHGQGFFFSDIGAARFADTSLFTDAELCFEANSIVFDGLELGDTNLYVEVTTDRGANWETVDVLSVLDLWDDDTERTVSLDGHLSEGFGVRFVVNGLLDGEVFIDDVEILGQLDEGTTPTTIKPPTTTTTSPTTTTTTTRPTTTTTTAGITSSTVPATTSTTVAARDQGVPPIPTDQGAEPPAGEGGLRLAYMGIQADYDGSAYEDGGMVAPEVLGLTVEYSMAVEMIAANWVWTVVLVLLVSGLLLVGIERRNRDKKSAGSA
jgi:hypothetical protein